MDFDSIKPGDMIRVTTAAHTSRRGFGGPAIQVPEKTVIVRVDNITGVNSQPGRRQAFCTVLVTAEGEDLSQHTPESRPAFHIYSDSPIAPQTFALA